MFSITPTLLLCSASKIFCKSRIYDYRICKTYKQELINGTTLLRRLAYLAANIAVYPTLNNEPWNVRTYKTTYGQQTLQVTQTSKYITRKEASFRDADFQRITH